MQPGSVKVILVGVLVLVLWFGAGPSSQATEVSREQAAYQAGLEAVRAEDYDAAWAAVSAMSDSDHPGIQHILAEVYLNGPATLADRPRGLTLQKQSADAGHMRASWRYARALILPEDRTDADITDAMPYLDAAVACGMPMGHALLGWMYFKGVGVEQDIEKAIEHVEVPAYAGSARHQFSAGLLYVRLYRILKKGSREVSGHIFSEGATWIGVAAENGIEEAQGIREDAAIQLQKEFNSREAHDLEVRQNIETRNRLIEIQNRVLDSCI